MFDFLGVPDPDRPLGPRGRASAQRRLLGLVARMARARSLREAAVLVLEDLHWIDGASAVFFEALAAAVAGTRTIVVGTYRPEYTATWAGTQINLGPLDAEATGDLLTQLLGCDDSLQGLEALIRARTRGNPFFIEEIVQALAENGHLTGTRGQYRLAAELDTVVLPPTVQAGLAARIDRLPQREKVLVQTMSVIGTEIPEPLLGDVSDLGPGELADAVEVLAHQRWIVPCDASGGREYAFKHPLTQEVAYRSQLSDRRARAHRTVAAAIAARYPDTFDERAALLAHHWEASGDKLKAADGHARAAVWVERTSLAESLRHWRRVRHLASQLDVSPERDALAARARIGILSLAWRLGVSAKETEAIRAEAAADVEQVRLDLFSAGTLMHSGHEREGLAAFRQVSRQVVAAGDPGQVLTASSGVAYASWVAGSLRESLATLDGALGLAGDDPKVGSGLSFVCPVAHARGHRAQCLGYMGEIEAARRESARAIELAGEHDDPETESAAHASRALLEAEIGELEAALDHAALGLAIAERTGNVVHMIASSVPAAVVQARGGRFLEALALAESNLTTIRRQNIGLYFEPLLLATIARSRLGLGELGEARKAAEEAVAIVDTRGLATCRAASAARAGPGDQRRRGHCGDPPGARRAHRGAPRCPPERGAGLRGADPP